MARLKEACMVCAAYPCECPDNKRNAPKRPAKRDVRPVAASVLTQPARPVARPTMTTAKACEIWAIQNLAGLLHPDEIAVHMADLSHRFSADEMLLIWSELE